MPVDPPIQLLLDQLAANGGQSLAAGTPEQARQVFEAMTGMLAVAYPDGRTPVGEVEDTTVAGRPVRVYRPVGLVAGHAPTTVMLHGGGFVIGSIASHDDTARMLCAGGGGVVVSVDYRLAPEDPYPAGLEDCEAVTRAVLSDISAYGGDPARVGVAGDSAGGNLAAVLAQRLRDGLAAQLLWYPAVDVEDEEGSTYPSRVENGEGYFLTAEDMRWFSAQYLPAGHEVGDPGASPIRGDLAGLPPAVVATAEYDPLRDEGEAYAAALEKAGVTVVATRYDGLIHGFAGLGALSPAAQLATEQTITAYAGLLG